MDQAYLHLPVWESASSCVSNYLYVDLLSYFEQSNMYECGPFYFNTFSKYLSNAGVFKMFALL